MSASARFLGSFLLLAFVLTGCGSGSSSPSPTPPSISVQPGNAIAIVPQTASFSVTATGTAPLSYLWKKSGTDVAGATASSYTTPAVAKSDNGATYTVTVSNSAGTVTSNPATLTVQWIPAVTVDLPSTGTVTLGQPFTLTATFDANPAPTVKWLRNGVEIPGATATNYTFTPAKTDDGAIYKAVATNSVGSTSTRECVLTVQWTPTITTDLSATATVLLGQPVSFTCAFDAKPTPNVKWLRNGVEIPGAQTTNYTFTPAKADNGAIYKATATNPAGTASTRECVLTVQWSPVLVTDLPATVTVEDGSKLTLTTAFDGSPTPTISWQKNGQTITGATGSSYAVNVTTSDSGAVYKATATNGIGNAASTRNCTLTVTPAGVVTRQFWVNDLDAAGTWFHATFKRSYRTDRANVWVRPEDEATISKSLLQHYGDYFTEHSWPDVTTYVYQPTEFFGEEGNRINILFYNMYVDYAGYFWGKDLFNNPAWHSNMTNVFYMNIGAAVDSSDQDFATLFTEGTLTHEFQHMCNAHYFYLDPVGSAKGREMDTWANEFCSVTMESAFAGQIDIYVPSYKSMAVFKRGACDFLQWRNDWTQYVSVSMLGTFLLSQAPEANRKNLYSRFLANTCIEGNSSQTYTSVEDLLATLQDPMIGWKPAGWTDITNFDTQTDRIRDDWSSVFKAFGTGLTGTNTAYATYISQHSSQTISPALISTSGGSFALKPSGFFIGKTNVANLASNVITDASSGASGTTPAYAVVYNATIPSDSQINDPDTSVPAATTIVVSGQIVLKIDPLEKDTESVPLSFSKRFNRASGPLRTRSVKRPVASGSGPSIRPAILGAGATTNGGSSTAGYNYCFYVPR